MLITPSKSAPCSTAWDTHDEEETLASTNISATDREQYINYDRFLAHFDSFFKVLRNVIFERAKFNRRAQQRGEPVEQFITALYHLAETCEYGALRDEMLRDRIVVGIADSSLSERLQMIEDLTLEKAKTLVRQREAVHEQQLTLQGQIKSEPHLDAVQRYPSSKGKSPTTGKAVGTSAFQHQPPTRSSVQN